MSECSLSLSIHNSWSAHLPGMENVVGNDFGRQDDEDDDAVKATTDRVGDLRGRREARHR